MSTVVDRKEHVFALLGMFLFSFLLFSPISFSETHQIELRDDGFYPAEVTVSKGDAIVFSIAGKNHQYFWPASNTHPTHDIYPEFDPGAAIPKGETWTFVADREGVWRFHDHINPNFEGTITVLGAAVSLPKSSDDCSRIPEEKKSQCFEELMRSTIQTGGITAAFDLFEYLYETEPAFVSSGCHWNSHLIGEEAYKLFSAGEKFVLTPATSYCGYGFYHGFIQEMIWDSPDLDRVREFCDYVDRELSDKAPNIRNNCYHGIGHGYVEEPPAEQFWGKPRLMIKDSLEVCDHVSSVEKEMQECWDGAYNAVVLFMEAGQYGLTLDKKHLFEFCKEEEERHRRSCIYEFAQKLDSTLNWDIGNITKFTRGMNVDIARMITGVATAGMMQRDIINDDHTSYILDCRTLPEFLRESCLKGVVSGFRAHGEPKEEYVKALVFCESDLLSTGEKRICWGAFVNQFSTIYSVEKVDRLCALIENEYRHLCIERTTI